MSAATGKPSLAVVIPMYNEKAGAEACVRQVCEVVAALDCECALVVVDDGSSDGTGEILAVLAPELPQLMVATHDRNQGYGAALKTGTRKAAGEGFDYVLFMDSDLTNAPGDIPKFIRKMEEGYEVIKATRYSHGGGIDGVPFLRYWISRIGNLIARILFGLPIVDCTNGFRAIRTEILMKMELQENNFSIIMEELYYCKFLAEAFVNVPVVLTDRSEGQRQTSFTYRPSIFYDYLKYPLRSRFLGAPS